MKGKYPVVYDGNEIGTAALHKDGLYYLIHCSCRLPTKGLFRLVAQSGSNNIKLGIFAPDNGEFCVKSRIRISDIESGDISFQVLAAFQSKRPDGVPVSEEMPFENLMDLDVARLTVQGQEIRVLFNR